MRTNSFVSDKLTTEIVRRQQIFSSFMESFNTGVAMPPVMVQFHKRLNAVEEKIQTPKDSTPTPAPVNVAIEDLIETVDKHEITTNDFQRKAESTIKELTSTVAALDKLVNEKLKKVDLLNASIIQLNKTMEETINRVHSLEKRPVTPASTEVTGDDFATKQELKDTEKRIVAELTDKIDAEMIDAEERFNEKLKTSIEAVKESLEDTVGEEEEDDDNEEEDIEDVIDMD